MTEKNETPKDEAQWSEIGAWLRQRDPAKAAPSRLGERRRRRLVWLMQHPFFALAARHHRATACFGAATALTIVIAILFAIKAREQRLLPPVSVIAGQNLQNTVQTPALDTEFDPVEIPDTPPETPEFLPK